MTQVVERLPHRREVVLLLAKRSCEQLKSLAAYPRIDVWEVVTACTIVPSDQRGERLSCILACDPSPSSRTSCTPPDTDRIGNFHRASTRSQGLEKRRCSH